MRQNLLQGPLNWPQSLVEWLAKPIATGIPRLLRWLLIGLWLGSAIPFSTVAQTLLCPRERIRGFEAEHDLGVSVLPENMVGEKTMHVYVTQKDGEIYVQSNYRPAEYYPNPLKISSRDSRDLRWLHEMLYTDGGKFTPDFDPKAAFENYATFIFDEDIINSNGTIDLEIGPKISDKVYCLFDGSPPPRRLRQIESNDIPPVWMAEAENESSIFVKLKAGFRPSNVLDKLRAIPFKSSDIQVVSLFVDTRIEAKLANSSLASMHMKLTDVSDAGLEKVFATSPAKVITIFGHSDGESFVVTGSDSRKKVRISFVRVQELAEKYQKDVIYLGCKSYLTAGLGVDRAFNPLWAIAYLEAAVKAKNLRDFLDAFSSKELGMVIDETAFAYSSRAAESTIAEDAQGAAQSIEQSVEEGNYALTLVKKVRKDRAGADRYQLGREEGIVRFVTGYHGTISSTSPPAPIIPSIRDSIPSESMPPSIIQPASDLTLLDVPDKPPTRSIPSKAWMMIVLMYLLVGFLIFITFRKKDISTKH